MTAAPRTVLVVDDEPLLLAVLERLLVAAGMAVVGARHGGEALACLDEQRFDLILCDVRMPVMDGPTLLATLAARGQPHPPVLFLTGYADRADDALRRLGAVDVLGKPIEFDALVAAIARHARPVAP